MTRLLTLPFRVAWWLVAFAASLVMAALRGVLVAAGLVKWEGPKADRARMARRSRRGGVRL